MERVDEGGWPQQSKVFFLKIALLANASPSKLIRLPAGTSASRLQVLFQISLYPHWLNIGWRLFNDWLRISRYQISAHFTRWAHIQWHLSYIAIYLKIWRLSLQNISRCGPALKTRFLAGVHIWKVNHIPKVSYLSIQHCSRGVIGKVFCSCVTWPDLVTFAWTWVNIFTNVAENMWGQVGENPAALRAAVFSLSSINLSRGWGSNAPPPTNAPKRTNVPPGFKPLFSSLKS